VLFFVTGGVSFCSGVDAPEVLDSEPKVTPPSLVYTPSDLTSPQSELEILGVESPPEGHPMAREFSVIIERDAEGYYMASVPGLRGCHTQATSLDELMARVREAVELCLEVQGESVEPLDFIGVQKITVA
jgi:predicted RNase H-like HicB family nuclease